MKPTPLYIVGWMAGVAALAHMAPPVHSALPNSVANRTRQQREESRARETSRDASVNYRRDGGGQAAGPASVTSGHASGQRDSRSVGPRRPGGS
jgi:hypothetical protein